MTNAPASLVSVKIKSHQPLVKSTSGILRLQHAFGFHALPAQIRIQAARCQQSLDMADALVPGAFEVPDAQVHLLVPPITFPLPPPRLPLPLTHLTPPATACQTRP